MIDFIYATKILPKTRRQRGSGHGGLSADRVDMGPAIE